MSLQVRPMRLEWSRICICRTAL